MSAGQSQCKFVNVLLCSALERRQQRKTSKALKSKFNLTHHENETIVCWLVEVQRCHLTLLSFVE